jgi:hypothetical protein
MLAVIGFVSAALCVAAFAATASRAFIGVEPRLLTAFATAFYLLATDMLLWAGAAVIGIPIGTEPLIFASDIVLALATGYMTYVLFAEGWNGLTVSLVALAAAVLLAMRAFLYPPQAQVQDGLLYFNLQPQVRFVVLGALMLVWLPAVIKLARQASNDRALPGLQNGFVSIFLSLVLVTAFFLTTRQSAMVIASFVSIVVLFAAATTVNLLVINLHNATRVPSAAKHTATAK